MRRLLLTTLSLSLVACAATPVAAPTVDVTGNWTGTVLSPGTGYIDDGLQFTLTQDGAAVTGELRFPTTYSNGVPVSFEHFGSATGQVAGDQLTISARGDGDYAGEGVNFSATVGQSHLAGTLVLSKSSGSRSYTFTAQRSDTP